MAYRKYILFERAMVLALATVVCAGLTMCVGIAFLHMSLYGEPWFSAHVMSVAGPYCILCALLAYPFMLWGLVRTNLARSLPFVFVVAVGSMAVTARLGLLGAGISLLCSIVAMAVCRRRFRDTALGAPNPARQFKQR